MCDKRTSLKLAEVPMLIEHTVKLPVSVSVVPFDIAQVRVANPEVMREKLYLENQTAKRDAEAALREVDHEGVRARLPEAASLLSANDSDLLDDQLLLEIQ
ncbi:MAG: hypothetical protein ACOYD0_12040 [Candidatus Nanopelagicales bacterium]